MDTILPLPSFLKLSEDERQERIMEGYRRHHDLQNFLHLHYYFNHNTFYESENETSFDLNNDTVLTGHPDFFIRDTAILEFKFSRVKNQKIYSQHIFQCLYYASVHQLPTYYFNFNMRNKEILIYKINPLPLRTFSALLKYLFKFYEYCIKYMSLTKYSHTDKDYFTYVYHYMLIKREKIHTLLHRLFIKCREDISIENTFEEELFDKINNFADKIFSEEEILHE